MKQNCNTIKKERTAAPLEVPTAAQLLSRPEFIRLPKPNALCPYTGLSRSYADGLILPTAANSHKPPVRSFVLRKRGAKSGVRLIDYASLRKFILANVEETGGGTR